MPPRRLRTWATARHIDTAVAAGLLLWALPDVPWWWRPPGHSGGTAAVLGYLALALAMSVPFRWWRRGPLVVFALCLAVLATRAALDRHLAAAGAAVLVAAYGVGAFGRNRRPARGLGAVSTGAALVIGLADNYHRMDAVPLALLGAAFWVGDAATARRNEAAAAVVAARLAERTRIARELHDVLAHQLSAITVQAGAARLAPAGRCDPAEVLAAVERQGREALTELNHLLGVLRKEAGSGPGLAPAPTLAGLADLVARSADRGVPARFAVEGEQRAVTPGLQLSAYRIVQEALTNVARHAPGAATRVTVGYHTDRLRLVVDNQPPPHPAGPRLPAGPAPGGRGLLGMRERTALYGGTLEAAPLPGGGFRVTATLPYDTAAHETPQHEAGATP